ncbi:unnamed protein product, partial [Prorocentrum cordatum]
ARAARRRSAGAGARRGGGGRGLLGGPRGARHRRAGRRPARPRRGAAARLARGREGRVAGAVGAPGRRGRRHRGQHQAHAARRALPGDVAGGEWFGPANLERANLRITGMETYAIVAAVLLQVILGVYGSVSEPQLDDPRIRYPRLQRRVFEAQMVLLMIAVLCSTYTMVMFLLIKIYSVTALGLYKDVAYKAFTQATVGIRSDAFWALISSIITFLLAFSLNLYSKVKGNRGIASVLWLSVVTIGFVVALLREGGQVLMIADKLIFSA